MKFVLYFCTQILVLMDILEKYLQQRDFSGSEADEYAQDIQTFHLQSVVHNEEEAFLALLEKADREHKKVVYIVPEDIFVDDIYVSELTLA